MRKNYSELDHYDKYIEGNTVKKTGKSMGTSTLGRETASKQKKNVRCKGKLNEKESTAGHLPLFKQAFWLEQLEVFCFVQRITWKLNPI